ncbi:MAG: hypothetical protein Q7R95_08915 [bacterium]|nr:hypothetical protein [bacterium]
MKLKDFITSVLVDIEQGVNEAARQTNRRTYLHTMGTKGDEGVLFDVAVTASAEASGKVGAEVFSIGAKTEGKIANEEISRIRFLVKVGDYFKKK